MKVGEDYKLVHKLKNIDDVSLTIPLVHWMHLTSYAKSKLSIMSIMCEIKFYLIIIVNFSKKKGKRSKIKV